MTPALPEPKLDCKTGRIFGSRSSLVCKSLLIIWTLSVSVGLYFIARPERSRVPLVSSGDWKIEGGFFNNGTPQEDNLPKSMLNSGERVFWRSWSPETNASKGRIESAAFIPSGSTISLPVAGYPAAPQNQLYLQNEKTFERITFQYGNVHETWQELIIRIPEKWRNTPLKIIAESDGRAYIGVGTPHKASRATDLKTSLPASLAWHAIVCILLVSITALPRAALGLLEPSLGGFSRWLFFPLALILIGYCSFFGYQFSKLMVCAAAGLLVVIGIMWERKLYLEFFLQSSVFARRNPALLIWLLASLVTWLSLNAQTTSSVAFAANYRFTPASWSTDNLLPVWLAQALDHGAALENLRFGSWQVSDRPPAYAGIIAILYSFSKPLFEGESTRQLFFWLANLTGIVVMATWVFPLWALLRKLRIPCLSRIWVLSILTFTPFVFFNTVYVWPKLISASLALTAWILLDPRGKRDFSPRSGAGAGIAFAAALLSHGGIFFSHLAMGIWLTFTQLSRRWATFFICAGVFFGIMTTWMVWVHQVNPPGNALTKYAFAGILESGKPDQSLKEAVIGAYQTSDLQGWRSRKLESLQTIVGTFQPIVGSHNGWSDKGLEIRRLEFFNLLPALGVFVFSFALVSFRGVRPILQKTPVASSHLAPQTLLALGFLGIILQLILFWGPFTLHETSYGAVFGLQIGLAILALRFGSMMRALVSLYVILNFLVVWLISPFIEFGHVRPATLALAILITVVSGVFIILLSKRISRSY